MTPAPSPGRPFSLRALEEIQPGSQVRWIRGATVISLGGYIISLLLEFTAQPPLHSIVSEGSVILILGLALWMTYRVSPGVGAVMAVAAIFLELHISLLFSAEPSVVVFPVMPILVLGSGILLGGRAAMVTGTVSAFSVPLVIGFGRLMHGSLPVARTGDLKVFVTQGLVVVATALLTSLFLKSFGEALQMARRNARRFSDLVEGNPDGIIGLDAQGGIDTMNRAAESLLGMPASEALGRQLESLPVGAGVRLARTRPVQGSGPGSLPVELELTRPDGSRVWVEVVRKPMLRPDGTPGMILVLRDLTQKREVGARATQLGRIVEEARNEIFVFRRDSLEILMANRGARSNLGYTKEEILGMSMADIQPTLTPKAVEALGERLFGEDEGVVAMNTIHHRKDGSAYPLEVQFQKGLMEGIPSILAFGVDITEREKAEAEQRHLQAQLQHAQKMEAVGLLAGGVAHDFNNLLTVIGGCGEILMEIGDEEVRNLTGEIMDSQERGAALTRQLLAFARREIVQAEDLSLSDVIRRMETLVRRVLSEQIEVKLELEEGALIHADRVQIEQIVLNLAANARDAMAEGGSLTIRVEGPGKTEEQGPGEGYVTLSAEDTGHGMDPVTVERIFEPFYTTKPRGKGTGLGLSTVHGIVSQNGGRIRVESEVGQGTAIRILWPSPSGEVDISPSSGLDETPPPTKGTILVAEDEEEARALIRTVLEREGYRVVVVGNGQEALTALGQPGRKVDLLLTDIVMPGISGLELAEKVKEAWPLLPILFMSGYIDTNLQGAEGHPGSLNLLGKPFRPPELRKRIKEILEKK